MRLYNFIGDQVERSSARHNHPDYEFHFITEGTGIFRINDRYCHVKPGSFLISPPRIEHNFTSEEGIKQSLFFAPADAFKSWPQLEKEINISLVHIELDLSFKLECELIKQDSLSAITDKQIGAFYTILGVLLRRLHSPKTSNSSLMIKARQLLEENGRKRMTIKEIASKLSISNTYLIQLFKRETGMTPNQYMQKYKVDQSCYHLLTSNDTCRRISEQVGFEDPFYYSRIFKKIMGVSPSIWRKMNMN